jgi:iron-sulfur cluster assembly protein
MVTLSENAAQEIKRLLTAAGDDGATVRLGLESGGCAGTKYVITPGAAEQPHDDKSNQFGLTVLCDPISLTSLTGLKVDFVDALMGGGFKFDNPQAAGSCGCGASFRAAGPAAPNCALPVRFSL